MKKSYLSITRILVTLSFVLAFSECKKDDKDSIPEGIHAKIDGTSWSAGLVSTAVITNGTSLTVTGSTTTLLTMEQQTITLTTTGIATGKYSLGMVSVNTATYTNFSGTSTTSYTTAGLNSNATGEIEIVSVNESTKKITGKYSFTAYNILALTEYATISEGTFNVSYTEVTQ